MNCLNVSVLVSGDTIFLSILLPVSYTHLDVYKRQLYDMIPAVPQNSKPFGEWNKAKIMVYQGTVVHGQNDENVLEYHLWTKQWTCLLYTSRCV